MIQADKHILCHHNTTMAYNNLLDQDTHILYHYNMNWEDKKSPHSRIHSISDFKDKLDQHKFFPFPSIQDRTRICINLLIDLESIQHHK